MKAKLRRPRRARPERAEDPDIELSHRQRVWILIGLVVAGFAGLLALDPIPQDPEYHLFADARSFFGIPNFGDVVSNAAFTVVGVLGMLAAVGRKRHDVFATDADARPYAVYFLGVALVSLGSAYYHWAPSTERLLWDRLPMAVGFTAFCSALVADRIHAKAGNGWLMAVLVALGLLSLVYWHWTEAMGRGDLRFYAFVQFYPIFLIPFILRLFPEHRYTLGRFIAWIVGWYLVAKVLEHFDREIFDMLGGTVSGHTLKHLAAAVATYLVLRMLLARRTLPRGS